MPEGYGFPGKGGATAPSAGANPTGTIILYGSTTPPTGYLACDGTAVSRSTYAALFAVTSTAFGVGDGSTTFNLPDLRSRVPVGAGQGAGLTNRALGATGGEENHALSTAELAAHTHPMTTFPVAAGGGGVGSGLNATLTTATSVTNTAMTTSSATDSTGSGTAHNTMQPWQAVQYIIKT